MKEFNEVIENDIEKSIISTNSRESTKSIDNEFIEDDFEDKIDKIIEIVEDDEIDKVDESKKNRRNHRNCQRR